jgi:hypothetical protein
MGGYTSRCPCSLPPRGKCSGGENAGCDPCRSSSIILCTYVLIYCVQTKSHVSDAGRRRHRVRLPPTPDLPPAIPQDASGGQHQMRLPPNPDPSPAIPQAPGSTRISLSTEMERKYKELAKEKLCALILNIAADTDGAPETAMRDEMIEKALRTAEVELFGQGEFH